MAFTQKIEFKPKKESISLDSPPWQQPLSAPLPKAVKPKSHTAPSIALCDKVAKPAPPKKSGHTEKSMQRAIAQHFDWSRNDVFLGVDFGGGIADALIITRARVCTEVEIKISLSDWNVDQHKSKWKHPHRKKVGRFYYAVPTFLLAKVPEWLPQEFGLLGVREDGFVVMVKEAKLVSKYRAKVRDYLPLVRHLYWRYMDYKVRSLPTAEPLE